MILADDEYMNNIILKCRGLVEEDIVNYRKMSMFIAFPTCSFKCDKECGHSICQNSPLMNTSVHEITIKYLIDRYIENPLTHAIVLGGLEPLDSLVPLFSLIKKFRDRSDDDIVIYTGYNENENPVKLLLSMINQYNITNVYIKYGRFIPDQVSHYDETLGVHLASPNQYGKKVS